MRCIRIRRDIDRMGVAQSACGNDHGAPSDGIVTQRPHAMVEFMERSRQPDRDTYEVGAGEARS